MTAYVIFIREGAIFDAEEMKEYSRKNKENVGDFNLTVLSAYGALEPLEGEPADGVVLLQFPTVEEARTWYNSPGYQAAIPHRKKGANYRAMILEGL
jgi:uncharacterized protein (DUF1330 family)